VYSFGWGLGVEGAVIGSPLMTDYRIQMLLRVTGDTAGGFQREVAVVLGSARIGAASSPSPSFGSVPRTRRLILGMWVRSTKNVANAPNIAFE
jgi:hypothetical protein